MLDPATGKVEEKATFDSKLADDLVCGVGAYSAQWRGASVGRFRSARQA